MTHRSGRACSQGVATSSGPVDALRVGAADSAVVDAVFDELFVSKTGLPGPI